MTEEPTIVLYHRNCRDGFAAAAVASRYYQEQKDLKQVLFFGLDPSKVMNDLQAVLSYNPNCKIRSFDVSYTLEAFNLLKSHFHDLVIVDHHKTTVEVFPDGVIPPEIRFNNDYCGCVLAWKYYYGEKEVPLFLNYLQDRDLWKTDMPNSEIINQGLFYLISYSYIDNDRQRPKFDQWWEYMDDSNIWMEKANQIGDVLLKNKERDLDFLKKNARPAQFMEFSIMCCNATTLVSDLGNVISHEHPETAFTLLYRIVGSEVWFSLRSDNLQEGGGFDVSTVAKRFGGGGHRNASGFMCQFEQLQINNGEIKILPKK